MSDKTIEKRSKYVPASIQLTPKERHIAVHTFPRDVKVRTTMSKTITLTQCRTDFEGSAPKRYTTKCYLKLVNNPVWYSESVTLKIGSTKRSYKEEVFFKNKLRPVYWGENMSTEVKTSPKCLISELDITRDEDDDVVHYISLEPQQKAAALKSTDL